MRGASGTRSSRILVDCLTRTPIRGETLREATASSTKPPVPDREKNDESDPRNPLRVGSLGVLFGDDEGEVVLLDKTNGKVIWRCRLETKAEIKTLVADTDEGFFVASGDSFYWLVSREGKLLLRCNDTCSVPR